MYGVAMPVTDAALGRGGFYVSSRLTVKGK